MTRAAIGLALLALAACGCSRESRGPEESSTAAQAPSAAAATAPGPVPPVSDPFVAPSPPATSSPSGATSAVPPASASASGSAQASGSSATRLLDPGQPPRRKQRYRWHVDAKEELLLDLRTAASTQIGGVSGGDIPLPPVHIVVDVDPVAVSKEGTLAYTWRVVASSVTASASAPASMTDGMRAEVSAVQHLSGRGAVDARGLSQAADVLVDAASVVDAGATGQMVEQVRQTLRDVAVPWPVEEIGRGAKWQKVSQLDSKGSRLTQTDTFALEDVPADTGSVDDVLAQTAPPQVLRTPGTTSGTEPRMESMLASGTSTVHFDLGRLVPRSKFEGTTTMVVAGAAQKLTMVMRVGIDVEGKPR